MTSQALQAEALGRATRSPVMTNYLTIYREFMARGIPEREIRPRENVFTFHAWRALGRYVKRGEHGVRIPTWIDIPERLAEDGTVERPAGRRPHGAVVFHISQTEARS